MVLCLGGGTRLGLVWVVWGQRQDSEGRLAFTREYETEVYRREREKEEKSLRLWVEEDNVSITNITLVLFLTSRHHNKFS